MASHEQWKARLSLHDHPRRMEPPDVPYWGDQGSGFEASPDIADLFQGGPPYRNGHAFNGEMGSRSFGSDVSRVTVPVALDLVYSDMGSGGDRGGLEGRHPVVWGLTIVGVIVTLFLMWWF